MKILLVLALLTVSHMRMLRTLIPMVALALTVGCGGAAVTSDGGTDSGTEVDAGSGAGGGQAQGGGAGGGQGGGGTGGGDAVGGGGGAGSLSTATFSFTPSWAGVSAVSVVGTFGDGGAWSTLLSLTDDGSGRWTGSSELPDGTYSYLFQVIGDAQGPAALSRYVLDPSSPTESACPTTSPTYNATNVNPCALLTMPQSSPAPTYVVSGRVEVDGAAAPGYLVLIEREEPGQHHFFADRATTTSSGEYALKVAAGHWRLQVWYPNYLTRTDAQRDPFTLQAARRSLTNAFPVSGPTLVGPAELGFHQYAQMLPNDGGSVALPAAFTVPRASWAASSHFAIYGSKDGGSNEIGDPWASGPAMTDGGAFHFDGGFTTMQALETSVRPTERYFWGTVQVEPRDGGANWTAESMVFPVTFQ